MKIKDIIYKQYKTSRDYVNLEIIKKSAIPEFAEIEESELFEAIKPTLENHLKIQGYGSASLKYGGIIPGVKILRDGKRYMSATLLIENFQDGAESLIILSISPFDCYNVAGRNIVESIAEKEISTALRTFLSKRLGQDYIDKNNEYYTMIKNRKTEKIKTKAEKEINEVNDDYIDNIII